MHDRDRHLPIGYLPLSAQPRASAHQGPCALLVQPQAAQPDGKAPVPSLCLRLKWMAAFEECATFTCVVRVFTCRTRLFSGLEEKSRHASLIIRRLSAPLPRSLLWVQCEGGNQLPWIHLPQRGDGVSWCGEVVLSETESHGWFSALPQPRLTAVFKAPVVAVPASTHIYLYTLNTKLFG